MRNDTMEDQQPVKRSRALPIANAILLVLNLLGCSWLMFCTTFARDRFEEVYDGMLGPGVSLPAATVIVMSVPKAVYALIVIVAIAALIAKEYVVKSRKRRLLINVAALVLEIGFFVAYITSLFQPLCYIGGGLGS
jgi:hypothetical protein